MSSSTARNFKLLVLCAVVLCLTSTANRVHAQTAIPAEIVLHPEPEISADYNSGLTLTCVGYGFPLPSVTWFRDGEEITNSTMDATIFEITLEQDNMSFTHSILELCPLQLGGNFSCAANGTHTVYFQVTVIQEPVLIFESPPNTVADISDSVSFSCSARGIPLPAISWFKDGSPLDLVSANITTTTNSTYSVMSVLNLEDLVLADAGIYSCNASHPVSGTELQTFNFTLESAVNIVVSPADIVVTVGETLSIPCTASGIPPPEITWFRNGQPLSEGSFNTTESVFSNDSSHFTLSVLHLCQLQLEDADSYSCMASNSTSQGESMDRAVFMIEVQADPVALEEPQSQTVPEGERVELNCSVSGGPLPTIAWLFAGAEVIEDSSLLIDTVMETQAVVRSTLTLLAARLDQVGEYSCVANNTLNTTLSRATVSVFVVPSILLRPEPTVSVDVGSSGVLTCVAYGVPEPDIIWFQNGIQIVNGTGSFNIVYNATDNVVQSLLEICPVQPEHAGTYTCMGLNMYGNGSAMLELTVNEGNATIFESPPNTVADISDSVNFSCSARGIPLPTITWFKDGSPLDLVSTNITTTTNSTYSVTSVLYLDNLVLADAGNYSCNASHEISGSDTREFAFQVEGAVNIVLFPLDTNTSTGNSISLPCTATGIPPPSVAWFRGDTLLSTDTYNITEEIFSNQTSHFIVSVLHLCDLQIVDTSQYTCAASNTLSQGPSNDTASFFLQVHAPPNITTSRADQTVTQGDNALLSCTATGLPQPMVAWMFVSEEKEEVEQLVIDDTTTIETTADNMTEVTSTLTLLNVQFSERGLYICTAINTLGNDSSAANLTVYVPSSLLLAPPINTSVALGDSFSLTCVARGYPLPSISWSRDGSPITSGGNFNVTELQMSVQNITMITSILELCNAELFDSGAYVCSAANSLSTDPETFSNVEMREFNLSVLGAPVFSEQLNSTEEQLVAGDSTDRTCTATGNPQPQLRWQKDGMMVMENEEFLTVQPETLLDEFTVSSTLRIGPSEPAAGGIYSCIADGFNPDGSSTMINSNTTITFISPPNILQEPSNVAVFSRNENPSFSCTFEGQPLPSNITWSFRRNGTSTNSALPDHASIQEDTQEGNVTSVLTLSAPSADDAGDYTCTASNGISTNLIGARSSAFAQLFYRDDDPFLLVEPTNTILVAGGSAVLQCEAGSQGSLTVSWTKDDDQLQLTTPTMEADNVYSRDIMLENVVDGDSGNYICTAYSQRFDRSVVSRQATVTVFTPVSILESPNDTTVNMSTMLTLECLVQGSHNVTLTWVNGTTPVSGSQFVNTEHVNSTFHRGILTIQSVTVSDAGSYNCNVVSELAGTNFTSSDSAQFTLTVQRAPVIVPQEPTVAITNGSSAEIRFNITKAIPMVRERDVSTMGTRHDGMPLPFNVTINGSDLIYFITSVDLYEDEGNYTVFASNPAGDSQSTIFLDIQSPPVMLELEVSGEVEQRRMNYVAVERGRVVFTCSFLADPKPTVIWQRNNININTNQPSKYMVEGMFESAGPIGNYAERLEILSVVEEDQGSYTCIGNNTHSDPAQPVSDTQPLEVIVPPTVMPVDSQPIGVETRDGRASEITIEFTITRDDPPVAPDNITWTYRNGTDNESENVEFLMTSRFQLSSDKRSLTIFNISFFDRGELTLNASNEAGTGSATLQLIVHAEPLLLNQTSNTENDTLVEGETATFSCFAEGYPLPTILWLRSGNLISTTSTSRRQIMINDSSSSPVRDYIPARLSTLTVPGLTGRDEGEYRCRVNPANINRGRSNFSDLETLKILPAPMDYCNPDPCENGVCSNQSSTYLCTCDNMWIGINCSNETTAGFDPVEIPNNPTLDDFPELFTSINLTCDAQGNPEPNITWFKDNVLLPGERSRTLVIQEVDIVDRGLYKCEAENVNPTNEEDIKRTSSLEVVVNIKGIAQYLAMITIDLPRRRKRQTMTSEEDIFNQFTSRLSGLPVGENATIYSVSGNISSGVVNMPLTITLLTQVSGSAELTQMLSALVNTTAQEVEGVTLIDPLQRFDGCLANVTVLPASNGDSSLDVVLEWEETNLGDTAPLSCPCGNLSLLNDTNMNFNRNAFRRCGGNFRDGAMWDAPEDSECDFSITTRQLCRIASMIDEPEEAISQLEMLTAEEDDISVDEFSVTTILIEAVSNSVEQNRNLTEGLFEVVDNLLDVDPQFILMSQEESNTTARILNVVEEVAQSIPIPENETSTTIRLDSFAVGVMEVEDRANYQGQVFSIDLGATFATKDGDNLTLGDSAVSFDKTAQQPTASLKIDPDFFRDKSVLGAILKAETSANITTVPRIVNSVYLTPALFPRINETAPVGSIILSSTLSLSDTRGESREVRVENINPPITLTFVKNQSLVNDTTDTLCTFWDFGINDGLGDWSTMNCILVNNNSDPEAVCECTHFTNFAILLDPQPVEGTEPPHVVDTIWTAVSYIGVNISIICLIVTVITYLVSKKLRTSEAGQLLLNLCFGLLGIYVLFIICLQATRNKYVCAVAGGLLHYFMLVSFFLMAAEAINLFLKLVIVLGVPPILKNKYVLKATLISWIVPLVIVVVSEAPDYMNYVRPNFCRPYGYPFYFGLVIPFGIIYILNWILFAIIFASLCRKKDIKSIPGGDKKGEMKRKFRQQFIIALTLSLLFGLGWGIGFGGTTSITVREVTWTLQGLFIILTAFQGLLIFIMQCVRSEDARKEWKRWAQVITFNKVTFEMKKKPKYGPHSVTSGEFTYRPKGSSTAYGTLSTSATLNSDTLKKAAKKDLEDSTYGTSTFGESTLETIDEVEKKDLSLNKEEKVKYELLSHTQSVDVPTIEEAAEEASPPDDGALLPEVPISPTAKAPAENIELASFDPALKLDSPNSFDVVVMNPEAATADITVNSKPTANGGGDTKVEVELAINADDLFNTTTFM